MNILLINHYAGSPSQGMEFRPYYMAREWIKARHNVTIVAASFSHLRNRNPDVTQNVTGENIDGIQYIWLKTPSYSGNGLGRIMNMLTFIVRLKAFLKDSIRTNKYDAVIASSTYPLDIYPAHMVQKKTKARFIFEIHDLWPLSPREIGNIPAWHPYIMLMQKAENDAYRYCDHVVSILPCAEQHMLEHGLKPGKFTAIPNGIVVEEWRKADENLPEEHEKVLVQLKAKGNFIAGYAGGHGLSNSLQTIIEAAELLKDDNVMFVFVGQGPEKHRLQAQVTSRKLWNAVFLPAVSKNAIPAVLASFDICLMAWQQSSLYRFGISPNKLMDYMMIAKPIINAVEAGNDTVGDAGCGLTVQPENPQAIVDAVRYLMAMSEEERIEMGLRGQRYVLEYLDYRVLADKFLKVLEE